MPILVALIYIALPEFSAESGLCLPRVYRGAKSAANPKKSKRKSIKKSVGIGLFLKI